MELVRKDLCPHCQNTDTTKIETFKEREDFVIMQCKICGFKWGVQKETVG